MWCLLQISLLLFNVCRGLMTLLVLIQIYRANMHIFDIIGSSIRSGSLVINKYVIIDTLTPVNYISLSINYASAP